MDDVPKEIVVMLILSALLLVFIGYWLGYLAQGWFNVR